MDVKMNIKHFFLLFLVSLMLPEMTWAQAKPKRDTKKDTKHIVKTTQKKSNTTTKAPVNTQSRKTGVSKSNDYFTISSEEAYFGSDGGTKYFTVSSNKPWMIIADTYDWGHLSKTENGLKLVVDANKESLVRSDYFKIQAGNKTIQVSIRQDGASVFEVSSTQLSFPSSGGSNSITVNASNSWEIGVKTNSWGHLQRNGNQLILVVDENKTAFQRIDYFTVKSGGKDIKINITQARGNSLTVSKEKLKFSSTGGSQTISIDSYEAWDISTKPYKWGHLSRSGHQLTLTVDANTTGDSRTDFFTVISGNIEKNIYIEQEGSYQNPYTSYHTNQSYVKKHKENWWKNRIAVGWNIIQAEGADHVMSFRSGLRLRFGKHSDFFNFIIGGDYVYHTMMDKLTDFDLEELVQHVGINANLRFNVVKLSRSCSMYLGCEGEYAIKISSKDEYSHFVNDNSINISPEIGFHFKKFDIGFNYRKYLDDYHLLKNYSTDDGRWGGHLVWYF